MGIPVGGFRARLIKDAVYYTVYDGLDQLGWFDVDRGEHKPVELIPEPKDNDEKIEPNLVALDDDSILGTEAELGSNLEDYSWDMVFDVYAENSSVGMELAIDIRDILAGKFPSIGRGAPVIEVSDLSQATPVPIFKCELTNISYDRVRSATKSWQKNWFVVFFTVNDSYKDDSQENEVYP